MGENTARGGFPAAPLTGGLVKLRHTVCHRGGEHCLRGLPRYIPVKPERAIPSVKFFCKQMYKISIGSIEIRQPASIHTISSRTFTELASLPKIIRVRFPSRFFSIRAMVLFSVKNEVLT